MLLVAVLCLSCPRPAAAEMRTLYPIVGWGSLEGLAVAPDGVVWVNGNGLHRFDGSSWKTFTALDTGAISTTNGAEVVVDRRGAPWFLSQSVWDPQSWSLTTLDGSLWKTFPVPVASELDCIQFRAQGLAIDGQDKVWVATSCNVSVFDGAQWRSYDASNSPLGGEGVVRVVFVGDVAWLATPRRLARLDTSTNVWAVLDLGNPAFLENPGDEIRGIAADERGVLWVATLNSGLLSFDGTTWRTYTIEDIGFLLPWDGWEIVGVFTDRLGGVWVDNGSAAFRLDLASSTWTRYDVREGCRFLSGACDKVAAGPSGPTWCVGWNQICSFDGATWRGYPMVGDGIGSSGEFIDSDSAGRVWFYGSKDCPGDCRYGYGSTVSVLDGARWTHYDTGLEDWQFASCTDLAIAADGTAWLASNAGLHTFDGATGSPLRWTNAAGDVGIARKVAVDGRGVVWVANEWWMNPCCDPELGDVRSFDGSSWTVYTTANSPIPSVIIFDMEVDVEGAVWLSFDLGGWIGGGVGRFDGSGWTFFTAANSGLADDQVWDMAADPRGGMWFATSSGASHYDETGWFTVTKADGLPASHIYQIETDERGDVWFASKPDSVAGYQMLSRLSPVTGWTNYSGAVSDIHSDRPGSFWFALTEAVVHLTPDWAIRAGGTRGGTITPAGRVAVAPGMNQTFAIVADPGKVVAAVLVDGVDAGPVSTYTFAAVGREHTITAHFSDPPPPTTVTLIAPSGAVAPGTAFSWAAQAGAASYQLWVGTGSSTAYSAWYTAAEAGCGAGTGACTVTPSVSLAGGRWYFNVRGRNASGTGPWAVAKAFAIATISSAPTLVSPTGAIGAVTPVFTWVGQSDVESYQLWVGTGTATAYSGWFAAASLPGACASGAGTCAVGIPVTLPPGAWFFNVRGRNPAGTGPWAVARSFSTIAAPTALTLLSPTGAQATATPAFAWAAQPGVDSYQLWVGTAASTAYSVWYPAAAVGCGAGAGTCTATPTTALAAGSWYFNVRGRNAAGPGPWTRAVPFTTP